MIAICCSASAVFDDVLIREGVQAHYLPMLREGEKNIDTWLCSTRTNWPATIGSTSSC